MAPRDDRPVMERILSNVEVRESGCWEYTGIIDKRGYGVINFPRDLRAGRTRFVHRHSYEALVGPIPDGLQIDHLCRNTLCVNPEHLEPVTSRENTLRGVSTAAQNARKTHCKRGHPLSGDNLRICVRGKRICRTCAEDLRRARRQRARV